MGALIEIKVPAIGDFKDVPVIEVLVKPGDTVRAEDALLTLESDKATMDIPSPAAGVVKEVKVKTGDKVSEGMLIVLLETNAAASASTPRPLTSTISTGDISAEVVVIGSGPGGYTAAFRAADLGKKVVLVERYPNLGGVCTNVGCIPSKALLHLARVITEAEEVAESGIGFAKPAIDIDRIRAWKDDIVSKGTKGIAGLARQRNVTVVQGSGKFESPHSLLVESKDGKNSRIAFEHCIIAAGSSVARIPGFPYDDPRLIDSTGALQLAAVPQRMLVIGGGIIGLEMACAYDALGAKVTVVELMDGLIPGADRDLIRPLEKRLRQRYEAILLSTKVAKIEAKKDGLVATFEGQSAPAPQTYDCVLFAVGRHPNGREIGADAAGVSVNERGFIPVDKQCRTNVPHIFAIGDIVGEPMLAHKASHEAKVVAEVIAGHKVEFDARAIPSVAYTDPEIAWAGLTEIEAKRQGIAYEKASFPWAASGRARAIGRTEGSTKLLYDPQTKRLLGAGIVGVNAGELIAEMMLALEMGADMEDIALTIHPHPTLSETPAFAAEMAEGSITDLYLPRKKPA